MEYYIYLDVFFLRNFLMNLLCLMSVSLMLCRPCLWKRILLGSITGALWNAVVLWSGFLVPGMTILTAAAMCCLAYYSGNPVQDVKALFLLLFTAFCMEGAITWFQSEIAVFIIPAICCLIGKERKKQTEELKVILFFKGRTKEIAGFYDSGNRLLEPLTGKMVHIVCYEDIKDLFPESYRQVIELYFETEFFESTKVTELQMYEFTFLSYHSIGKENGQLLGIRMDSAEFESAAGKKTEEKVVIGLTKQSLFVKGRDRIIVNGRLEL